MRNYWHEIDKNPHIRHNHVLALFSLDSPEGTADT